MRILFNTHIIRPPLAGIARYTLELANALSNQGHEVSGLTVDPLAVPTTHQRAPWQKYLARLFRVRGLQTRYLQARLNRHPKDEGWIYHEPNYIPLQFDGPVVITVHDLAWIRYPETHPAERVHYLERHFPAALERADHILTVSRSTREELRSLFSVPEDRITLTPLGFRTDRYRPRDPNECLAVLAGWGGLSWKGYLLSVGTLEPRKNIQLLIDAHDALPPTLRDRYPLVLAGAQGWKSARLAAQIERKSAQGQIKALGYVPEAALPCLYAGARIFIYPSLYEGFGLPPLEAMASGTPVITSTTPALQEVGGNATLTVDPHDPKALAAAIQSLVDDPRQEKKRIESGIERAKAFSWKECAKASLIGYKKAWKGDQRP